MSMNANANATRHRARIPATPTPPPTPQAKKQQIERGAFYSVAELRAITGAGARTIYAILRLAQGTPQPPRRKWRVTGAEFLALRAAYYGYTDAA